MTTTTEPPAGKTVLFVTRVYLADRVIGMAREEAWEAR
jgi:hypothetical protein